jgi:hypothetical protein
MAEVAVPFGAGTGTAMTTIQQYRDRIRPTQLDMIDAQISSNAFNASSDLGGLLKIFEGVAIVQGFRYELSGGGLLTSGNNGASNVFNLCCLTFDPTHNPMVYMRTISGTVGGALSTAVLTNSPTGVWDFPLWHYERKPSNVMINIRDRRKFSDGCGGTVSQDDSFGTLGAGWFPPAPRIGQVQKFMPSGNTYTFDGTNWVMPTSGGTTVQQNVNRTVIKSISSSSYIPGSTVALSMVCPPSGQIIVSAGGRGSHNLATASVLISFECRVGSSTGTVVQAAADNSSAQATTHGPGLGSHTSIWRHLLTGLTPGLTYYFRLLYRNSNVADLANIGIRYLMAEAVK